MTRVGVRTVLAVVHNVTAATRLFDVLALIAGDDRVRVMFTRTGSSAFDEGTAVYLEARGVRQLSWRQAIAIEFDLAVAASHGGDLHRLRCPLIIVPHGMGYNKFLETGNRKPETGNRKPETGNRKPVFGLSSEWLMRDGKVVPSVLVLSHDEQLDRLRRDCPDAVSHALVAGDIVYDQLVASRTLRPTYRRALGLSSGQLLVVVSSTWGRESLLGTWPRLAEQLAEYLPVDDFRIAIALHPNIWFGHSRWQVSHWLASCRRMGVSVLDDMDEWRSALVAADLLVGDHGSVGFYSTALGNPILLATAPEHTVAPDSAIAALLAAAPRLDPSSDLENQVRQAIANHEPQRYAKITALTTSAPDRAAALLRAAMYRLLNLSEPDVPAEPTPLPLPAHLADQAEAHLAYCTLDGRRSATVTRFPAERLRNATAVPRGAHLVAGLPVSRHRWLELADVVVGADGTHTAEWISDTLSRLPGCALAAAPDSGGCWLVGDQTGSLVRVHADEIGGRLFASAAYQVLGTGDRLDDLHGTWLVRAGAGEHRVTVGPGR